MDDEFMDWVEVFTACHGRPPHIFDIMMYHEAKAALEYPDE